MAKATKGTKKQAAKAPEAAKADNKLTEELIQSNDPIVVTKEAPAEESADVNQEIIETVTEEVKVLVLKAREEEKKARKIKAEFDDYVKNSVSNAEHAKLKATLDAKLKIIEDLKSQILELKKK